MSSCSKRSSPSASPRWSVPAPSSFGFASTSGVGCDAPTATNNLPFMLPGPSAPLRGAAKSKHAKEKPGAESGLRKVGKSGAPARGVGDGGQVEPRRGPSAKRATAAPVPEISQPAYKYKESPGGAGRTGAFCRHYQDTRTLAANCDRPATEGYSKQRHTRAPPRWPNLSQHGPSGYLDIR